MTQKLPTPVIDGGDNKGHRVITNAGKHSVEVNVRIRKAGEHSPVTCSTPRATPTPSGSLNLIRRGSWAEMLHRPNAAALDAKSMPSAEGFSAHKPVFKVAVGTQTEKSESFSSQNNEISSTTMKDYTETISQLYQLCSKLKEEVTEINFAKDKMESNLLGIIREKDLIISSYHNRSPVPPNPSTFTVTPPQESFMNSELNRFRSAIRDVRSLINEELEAMKRRASSPIPRQDSRLEEYLRNVSDVDVGAGDSMQDGQDPFNIIDTSSSESSVKGSLREMDQSSTQYLNLPRGK